MKGSVGGLLFLAKPKGCLRGNNLKRLHKKSFSKLLGTLYAVPLMKLVNQLKIKYKNHSHIYSSEGRFLSEQVANLLKGLKSELGLKKEGTEIKQPLASKVVLGQNLTITQVEASKQASRQQQNTGDIIYKIIHFIEKNINSLVYKGHEHIKIETEPPNLGVIDIELEVKGKHLSAIFFTRSFEVKQILESNIHQLKQAFLNKGIELSNFQISVADHSMSWFKKEYSEGSKSGERQFFRKGKIVSHVRNLEQKWIRANYGNIDVFI